MSIRIQVRDGRIIADQLFKVNNFDADLTIYKKYKCRFDPKIKGWEIPIPFFESIIGELEHIEEIYLTDEEKERIKDLRRPERSIKFERIPFSRNELKVQPIIGKAPYEHYQLEDLSKCVNHNRYALFNEQGTGKSWILCNTIDILHRYKGIKKVLVITSGSGAYNFRRELGRFSSIGLGDVGIGGIRNRRPFDDMGLDVIICSYRSFLLISDEYQKEYSNSKNYRKCPVPIRNWLDRSEGILILDESHHIANPQARQTKVIQMIAPFFEYRYLATGTPADKEEKYYSQLKILDSALVQNLCYYDWLQEYADIGNRFSSYAINFFKPNKVEELTSIIASVSSKRKADEVLTLPEHFIQKIYVGFSEEQKRIYQQLVTQKLQALQEAHGGLAMQDVVRTFQYLSLAIDNPLLLQLHEERLPEQLTRAVSRFKFIHHSKMEALEDLLEKHEHEKIIIWCSHPSVGFELASILEKKKPFILNGETKPPKGMTLDEYKANIIAEFQAAKDRNILIAGIQVLNSAVTIVEANVAIYFDRTWNYTEYNQSIFRIHRIGQQKTVYTYLLIIDNSLDCVRDSNLEDKDFITKQFGTQQYLDRTTAKALFEMQA